MPSPAATSSRRIGPFAVSAVSLGCMSLSHAYGTPPAPEAAAALLRRALELGCTMLDTAALYGFGANESLIGTALAGRRGDYMLASKCGIFRNAEGQREINGRPEVLRQTCEASLKRLGCEVIDLYYLHRVDPKVPVEDSVGALAGLVGAGKVRCIGLSEVSAATLRRAHAVHPIAAVQSEYSLWSRNPEIGVLETCRELGAAFVAFSPLARGFLTGRLRDVSRFEAKDIRRGMPRFESGNYAANLALLEPVAEIAAAKGCSMAHVALAWVLARGPHVVAIPGTTSPDHLAENFGGVRVALSVAETARLDAAFAPGAARGPRYNAATQAEIDTEEFT